MGEMVAWSREAGLGTPKHPPLPAWIVGVWFQIFPLQTWAYDLLAVATAAVALGIAWVVWPDYLDERKRAVALALLTLVPFFNFHALKYNANSAMMPWWALVTWAFLRSFETRSLGFAALAGLAAAGAMMTKYWSIVLLAALAIAALSGPAPLALFRVPCALHHDRGRRGGARPSRVVALCARLRAVRLCDAVASLDGCRSAPLRRRLHRRRTCVRHCADRAGARGRAAVAIGRRGFAVAEGAAAPDCKPCFRPAAGVADRARGCGIREGRIAVGHRRHDAAAGGTHVLAAHRDFARRRDRASSASRARCRCCRFWPHP